MNGRMNGRIYNYPKYYKRTKLKMTVKNHGVATIPELRELCIEADVKLVGCQMTVDLFGWKQADFIPEISEWAGAATYLGNAKARCRRA